MTRGTPHNKVGKIVTIPDERKTSKITVESNDPELRVEVNDYAARKNNRAVALAILLTAVLVAEALYIAFLMR